MSVVQTCEDCLRVTCSCLEVTHNLEIWISNDGHHDIILSGRPVGLVEKLKAVWAILRGEHYLVAEVMVKDDDLQAISSFLRKKLQGAIVHK